MDKELFLQTFLDFIWKLEDMKEDLDFKQLTTVDWLWRVINKYRNDTIDK